MDPYFLKRHGTFTSDVIIPLDKVEVSVGRKETPVLKIGPNISRNHATFMRSALGQWFVKDTDSLNGVYVNEIKIGKGLYPIDLGDIIGLGAATGDKEQDYVFILSDSHNVPRHRLSFPANNHVLESDEKTSNGDSHDASGDVKNTCHIAGHAKNVPNSTSAHDEKEHLPRNSGSILHPNKISTNFLAVQVKKEPDDTCTKNANNCLTIKQEAPQSLIDDRLSCAAFSSAGQNLGDSSFKSPAVARENDQRDNAFKLPKINSKASNSGKNIYGEKKTFCPPKSIPHQNGSCEVKPFPPLKELKVVLKKYDNILIETYKVEKHSTEDDAASSCSSDVVLPPKQRGHRLRIDSSSDESENCAGQKSSTFLNGPKQTYLTDSSSDESENCAGQKSSTFLNGPKQTYLTDSSSDESENCAGQKSSTFLNGPKQTYLTDSSSDESENCAGQKSSTFLNGPKQNYLTDSHQNIAPVSKQRGHRLRIDSSSDESENCADQKSSTFLNGPKQNYLTDSHQNIAPVSKQHGHRLRIDSSSDESENFADQKSSTFPNGPKQNYHTDSRRNITLVPPIVKPHAAMNIVAPFNNAETSKLCYTQEDEIIVISSDDDDDGYVKNLPPIKIKTEPMDDEEFSNSEWQYVSNSQNTYEHSIKNECSSDSETSENLPENAVSHSSVVSGSISETKLFPNSCEHPTSGECVDDRKALEGPQCFREAEPNPSDSEERLSQSENIENITKFLHCTVNNKLLPKNSLNHSKSVGNSSKNQEYDFFPPLTQSLLSDGESEVLDTLPHSDHPEVQRAEFQDFSKNNKDPPLSENNTRLPQTELGKGSSQSARSNTEIDCGNFYKKQKEKTLSKTVLTEAKPIQYRPRKQRGREEWFVDPYENDRSNKTVESKTVSKPERSESNFQGNSKVKVQKTSGDVSSLTSARRENSKDKRPISKVIPKRRTKKNNSSLRSQMQSMYRTIPLHRRSSTPAVVPSNSKQTCGSTKQQQNVSFGLKRKAPTVSDDHSGTPLKERKVVVKTVDRFSSRMTFLTCTREADTDHQNIQCVINKKLSSGNLKDKRNSKVMSSRNLTDKSHKKVTSPSSSYKYPGISVWQMDRIPKRSNESSSKMPEFHVPTANLSASSSSHRPPQTVSSSCVPTTNSLASHSSGPLLTPTPHVSTANSLSFHPQTFHAPAQSRPVPAPQPSLRAPTLPRSNVVAGNSSASCVSAVQAPTRSVSCAPASCSPASHPSGVQVPALSGSRFLAASSASHPSAQQDPALTQSYVPATSSSALSTPTLSGSHISAAGSFSSCPPTHLAPTLCASFVHPTTSSASCTSDPRQHGRALNRMHSTYSHGPMKNSVASGSASVTQNVAVVMPQGFVQPHPVAKLTVKFNSDTVILKILSWMPAWLREQQDRHEPPPVVEWNKIQKLKLFYESVDDYVVSFYNLLLIEMWESLFQDWREKNSQCDFTFVVTSYSENNDMLTLECESLLSSGMSHIPVEGTLLIIDLRMTGNQILKLFAYVRQCKLNPYTGTEKVHAELRKLPSAKEEHAFLCKFKLQTKKKKCLSIYMNKNMKASVLSYITPSVRIVNSLLSLQSSPLVKDILCPQEKNCTISRAVHANISALGNFSKTQASAIIAISDEMRKVYSVPRVLLLQGPPGTGKTHVIMGIIQNLLSKKHEKIKILVTAPSNAAADEIGRRLIALRKIQNQARVPPLCFVRVGIPKQIHPSVEPFSLDSLVLATYKKKWNNQIEKNRIALSEIQAKINSLTQVIESMKLRNLPQKAIESKQNEIHMQQRRAKLYEEEITNIKNKTVKNSDSAAYETKLDLLKNADVVLSTLSSCRQGILENAFGKKSDVRFTCCIIDEASQCTEPQVLQPLAYGMCKLLLVGDHQQLPATVLSKIAVDNGLEMSLFERINSHFKKALGRSPVHMLTEQYRMHSEICLFPSSHFYARQLRTPREIDMRCSSFPLKPYLFLNVAYCKESRRQKSKTNDLEAEIIIQLCRELVNICPRDCSMGVITPYQGQKSIYKAAFSNHISCRNIEVNTVDGFQGRERDLIIVSCVRAHSYDGSIGFLSSWKRLNVAITRAAKCLIICGHMASLEENSDWDALISDAIRRNLLIPVTSVDDVPLLIRDIRKNSNT